jgi:hypothetical protein
MNKLIIVLAVLLLSACQTTFEEKHELILDQVELAQTQKHGFCEGDKLQSYIETNRFYMWTCADGRNFMLPKED